MRHAAVSGLQTLGLAPGAWTAIRLAVPALHRWYAEAARDLPWRRTRDPYAIWVSEAMLQQTQVATVLPYFGDWMRAFPTLQELAAAEEEQVLRAWEGLGYYSRALNLHRAARLILERHGGELPSDPQLLRSLPGVGPYTAAAVLSIAFDQDVAVMDGNVRRVMSRLTGLRHDARRAPWGRALEELAAALLPPGTAALHNQAMMELGALICAPRAPRCPECPFQRCCLARASGSPQELPLRPPGKRAPHHELAVAVVLHDGRCLIVQRPYGGLLGGLWEFPGERIEEGETENQALRRRLKGGLGLRVEIGRALPPVQHAYSHFRVTLHPRLCQLRARTERAAEQSPGLWVQPSELTTFPMSRADRLIAEELVAATAR